MPNKYKNHVIGLLLLVIVVLVAVIAVPRWGSPEPAANQNATAMPLMAGMPMAVKTFDVQPGQPLPTVSFTVHQDSTGGWDLHLATTNFTFTPEKIDGDPVLGEGHIHLYVDGNLVVVLSPWYHIDPLASGKHTLRVALANNNHSLYTVNGKTIDQTQTIEVN